VIQSSDNTAVRPIGDFYFIPSNRHGRPSLLWRWVLDITALSTIAPCASLDCEPGGKHLPRLFFIGWDRVPHHSSPLVIHREIRPENKTCDPAENSVPRCPSAAGHHSPRAFAGITVKTNTKRSNKLPCGKPNRPGTCTDSFNGSRGKASPACLHPPCSFSQRFLTRCRKDH